MIGIYEIGPNLAGPDEFAYIRRLQPITKSSETLIWLAFYLTSDDWQPFAGPAGFACYRILPLKKALCDQPANPSDYFYRMQPCRSHFPLNPFDTDGGSFLEQV